MTDTTKNNVPDGFILLQTQNGAPKYAACMTGRLAGWLMKKYPDGNWVSERKLTNLEVMQAEDQRDDGIVHETPAATTQEPVMVAEPVGEVVLFGGDLKEVSWAKGKMPAPGTKLYAAPMVADPAGVALSDDQIRDIWADSDIPSAENDYTTGFLPFARGIERAVLAATVKAVPSEALDKNLLDALGNESWNLECFDMPTGGDDSEIGWRVIAHYMAEPVRRTVAEVYEDNPRAAIKAALAAPLADKTGGGE